MRRSSTSCQQMIRDRKNERIFTLSPMRFVRPHALGDSRRLFSSIMIIRGGLLHLLIPFTSLASASAGLMFLRGLHARWMLAVAALTLVLAASAASSDAGLGPLPLVQTATKGLGPLPFVQTTALGRPLKQPAIAVAVGLKNIIFPPCPPEVASSVKDQLGIAKFWNLWNITDNQDKTLFPVAKNESKARMAHPCTIFAVPDDSFAKQLDFYTSLEENPLAAAEFISNHIIGGPVTLQTNTTLTSVGGLSIAPLQKDGDMFINGIKVTKSAVKLPSGSNLYVVAGPLCCTSADVIPLATTLNGSVVSPISPSLGDVGSFVFDRPSISYLRKAHLLPANYTVKARHLSIGRGPSVGNGTGLTRYVYRSPASIWSAGQPSSIGVQNDSIYQVLPGLSGTTFLTLLQLADCRPSLKGRDPVTLFMPTDEALASLPPRDIQALIADPERLRQTLLYHIAPGTFTSGDLSTNVSITTVEGKPLRTDTYGNTTLNVEGAKVILSDIIGHNGVIHIIDRFLYPVPDGTLKDLIGKTPNVNHFLELCKRLNLTDYLTGGDPYTVFAPTNDALNAITKSIPSTPEGDKQLKEILLNHIVPGIVYTASWSPGQILPTAGGHTIYLQYQPNESGGFSLLPNGATVAKSDLGATNGVCHIINKVMPIEYAPAEPPQRTFWKDIWKKVLELFGKPEEVILPTAEEPPRDNITATLKKLPNAKELLDAFNITGLIPKLETAGPITVFVPVNSAFDQLKRPISDLIKTNRSLVEQILLNHIIPMQVYCEELKKLPTVKNLQGTILTISPSTDGCAKVDDSDILYWNITAKNGIIHLIDKILSAKDLIPEELLTTTEMDILTTTELEISTIQEILATTMGLPSTSTVPSVPIDITTEVGVSTSSEEGIMLPTERTTPVERVELTTIAPEELSTAPSTETSSEAPKEVSSVVTEEMSTVTVEISTETPEVVTEITKPTTLPPEIVTSVSEGISVVTTEKVYPSTTPTKEPIDTGYVIPGEETTTGQPPTGREFPGPPTLEKPVVYLPENVSDMITPRPMVTFTSSVPDAPSLVDLLHQLNLTTFPNMLNMTGLDETLPREGPLTIFAPTDAAFNKIDIPTLDKLFEDKEQLKRVLQYHVVPSPITGNELPRALQAVTLAGAPVFITVYIINEKPTAFVNNATIAPSQHNYNGTIVYLINMVLISPPEVDLYTTISKILKEETMTMNINKARLDPLLTGPGPITVFVPTEAAWNKLPEDLRMKLDTNETVLKDYILSHIIRGAVFTPVMTDGSKFITSNGKILNIANVNGLIKVNDSHIINPDIVAINGVIHVIDMVFPVDELQIVEVPTKPITVEVAATTPISIATAITSEQPTTESKITEEVAVMSTTETATMEVTSEHVSTIGVSEVTTKVPFTTVTGMTTATTISEIVTEEVTTEEVSVTTLSDNLTTITYPMTTPGVPLLIPALRAQGLTTLADLLESIFAPKILNLYGLFTLFAPTNEAFESLSSDELKNLKADSQALQQMLLYHAINRILPYDDITDNLQVPSIQGNNLTFNVYDDGRIKSVLGSEIIRPDIKVENGLVHIINRTLYPIPRKPLLEVVDSMHPSFSTVINKTNNRPDLTDKGVTAFIPSEEFWALLPQPIRDKIFSNSTLMNDIVKDHVCSGRIYKVGIRDGISCISLSGKELTFTVKDNVYNVHGVPIIVFDLISTDGIIHVINRPLFLEVPGYREDIIGPIPSLPPTRPPPKRPGEMTTEASETTHEITTTASEETSTTVTEYATSAEITTEIYHVTEKAIATSGITEEATATEYTSTTSKPEILTDTERTTVHGFTEEIFTRTTPFREEITTVVTETAEITTSPPEHTTVYVTEYIATTPYSAMPNATIPSILQQQFQDAGYPIEVTELTPKLPDTTLYTAFIPYSVYLSGLPIVFLQDLAKNTTAIGDIFANHICPGARYSPEFQNGFSCVSLGGNVITITLQNGKYYCNGFPLIRVDVPALDGVVHFINGLIFFEPVSTTPTEEHATTTAKTTQYPELTTFASTEEIAKTEIPTTTEIEGYTVIMNVTVPAVAQVTEELEYSTVTRRPKELNVTEATELTTYPTVTTLQPTTIEKETKYIPPETTEESTLAPEYTTGLTMIAETAVTTAYTPTTQTTLNKTESTVTEYQTTELTTGISEYSTPESTTKYPGIPHITAETTETAEYTTVGVTTGIPAISTETILQVTLAPNTTIAATVQEEFTNAGYPIDVTDLQKHLPDTKLYTAFIPYSVYLSGLPSTFLQDLVNNKTAVTDIILNHICQDATYSPEFQNGFTCTSIGGKPITVTNVDSQYYCNGIPIVRVDIPVVDGVIHLINGILHLEPEGVTLPALVTVPTYKTTASKETTLGEEATTAISEVTVYAETTTTEYAVTREPKALNITEITDYPKTTEITYTEAIRTTSKYTEAPTATEYTESTTAFTEEATTAFTEESTSPYSITEKYITTKYPEVTAITSRIPHVTEEFTEKQTVSEVSYATTEPTQYTTETITVQANETIPSIFEKEFAKSGYPIDVTELKYNLPSTFLYTACVPYSSYLSSLPHTILQDLTRNKTATTSALLNHICKDAIYTPKLKNEYTCIALGGKQLKLSYQNNRYYCNNFPIIQVDVPTNDGVVYIISGMLFFEPEGITAPSTEPTTTSAIPVTTTITIPEETTGTPETTKELSTIYGIPEHTTLEVFTTEPEIVNITASTTIYPVTREEIRTTEYAEITTEIVSLSELSTTPEVIPTKFPGATSEIVPKITTTSPEYYAVTSVEPTMKTSTEQIEVTSTLPETTGTTTAALEYATTTTTIVLPNVTIPSTVEEQFEKAGYPIDVSELQENLPDTSLYTACIPYSQYISTLPKLVIQDLTTNKTAVTNALLDLICQGATYSNQLKDGYTCQSLGGKPVIFEFFNNRYYCNKFPVIKEDYPTSDGVVYFINGFVIMEDKGITQPSLETTTVYTEASTLASTTGILPEVATGIPEITTEEALTTSSEVTTYTTLKSVTREPKLVNISEPTTVSAIPIEVTSTEYQEITTQAVPSSEAPTGTTLITKYPEVTSESISIETTEYTATEGMITEYPAVTKVSITTEVVTKHPESTSEVAETTTVPTEYTTSPIPEVAPNDTIPSIFQQQFEKAGYPIDVTEGHQHLPDTSLYTACIPYSLYLSTLPSLLLQDQTKNNTAMTNALLDHICKGVIHSSQLRNGFTCTSLGGKTIIFTSQNDQYYCNNFPIIKADVSTSDGIVHFINGLLFFEHEGITTPPTEISTAFTKELTTGITPIVTTSTSETTTKESLLTSEVPEYTTLETVTREPKVLNATEPMTAEPTATDIPTLYPEGTTQFTTITEITTIEYPTMTPAATTPEAASEAPKTTEKPLTVEYTTPLITTVAPNRTIPSFIEQQFEKAGYPIDVTEVQQHLPETTLYTACLPYYTYLSTLPTSLILDLTRNNTAISSLLLNHICEGVKYSSELNNDYTCTSLQGKPIILSFHNNQYYCNNYPVIQVDVPAIDGVIYFINGFFLFKPEEIITPVTEITTAYTEISTPLSSVSTTGITQEAEAATSIATTEISIEGETTTFAETEYTTLKTVTRGPKVLNISETTEISPETTKFTPAETASTEYTQEISTTTTSSITTAETTVTTEAMTTPAIFVNETIPQIMQQQFTQTGYPIDVSDVKKQLPDTLRYTACIPDNTYLSTLPSLLLRDLVKNLTATTSVLLNHICPGEIYSSQFQNGFTCISLGGKPIFLTIKYGQYYCNNIQIIQYDIPTADGVVHLINGLLFFEPPSATSAVPEITTTYLPSVTEVTPSGITEEFTTEYFEVTTKGVTPESTTYTYTIETTEMREPKLVNITEPTEVYPETTRISIPTEYPGVSTAEPITVTYKVPERTTEIPAATITAETAEYTTPEIQIATEFTSARVEYTEGTELTSVVPAVTYRIPIETEKTSETPGVTYRTTESQYTSTPFEPSATNKSIPELIEQEFEKAGYPTDATGLKPNLPETHNYIACVPYSNYLSRLSSILLQDITTNSTAFTKVMLTHICINEGYEPNQKTEFSCISLAGTPIILSYINDQHFCNNIPIISEAIPTIDGIVYYINGFFAIEPEIITSLPTELPTEIATTSAASTEISTIEVTIEALTSVEPSSEQPVVSETSPVSPEFTTKMPALTEFTTVTPVYTSVPEVTLIETASTEYTTETAVTAAPNETIPSIIKQQFETARQPVDIEDLKPNLPDTYLYTACVPYSTYLLGLPTTFLQDFTKNNTAVTNSLLNHICRDAAYSPQIKNGYTCTTLGGMPLVLSYQNGQYFCNKFPIIKMEVPTVDGVVYFINGLLFYEHEGIIPPQLDITTLYPELSTTALMPEITTGKPEIPVTEAATTATEAEVTSESVPTEITEYTTLKETTEYPFITRISTSSEVTTSYPERTSEATATEYTTLSTVTREPKVLNVSEPSVIYTSTTEKKISTQLTEESTAAVPSTEMPTLTERITKYSEATSESVPTEITEYTTLKETTEYPFITTVSTPSEVTASYPERTTEATATEYTTLSTVTREPKVLNVSEPSVIYTSTTEKKISTQLTEESTAAVPSTEMPTLTERITKYSEATSESVPTEITEYTTLKETTEYPFITTVSTPSEVTASYPERTTEATATEYTTLSTVTREPKVLNVSEPSVIYTSTTEKKISTQLTEESTAAVPSTEMPALTERITKYPEATSESVPTEITEYTTLKETTEYAFITTVSTPSEVTASYPERTSEATATEYTTLATVTSEPKILNVSEPSVIYTSTTEKMVSTQLTEESTAGVPSSEMPALTERTTKYPETTSESVPTEITEYITLKETTEYPFVTRVSTPSEVTTSYPEKTSEVTETTLTTTIFEETTALIFPVSINDTIPLVIQHQFEQAGYPIDTTEVQDHLPDTSLYTACVPYSTYLSKLPSLLLQDLIRNNTAITNALLDHICEGVVYSSQLKNEYTCTSLGGKPIILALHNNQYYCNNFPVVQVDVPTKDGVIYFINGFLFLEPQGITPSPSEITTFTETSTTEKSTKVTTGLPKTTEASTEFFEITEYTTLKTVSREPKILNITEPAIIETTISEKVLSTEYPEITTEAISSEVPTVTEVSIYPGVTPEDVGIKTTEHTATEMATTTEYPGETTKPTIEYPEVTSQVPETISTEYTTPQIPKVEPNETIPFVIKEQFEISGFPIDVTDVQQHLPDTSLYTACIPSSTYLSTLPSLLLQDLARNKTGTTNALLDHICPGAAYSSQFKNGYTCISLGGKPIVFTFRNLRYYCNNFPVIKEDVPTKDGVIHFIGGFLIFEPGVTPSVPEISTLYTEVTRITPTMEITELTEEGTTSTLQSTETEEPLATFETTEYTTLKTVTREPKIINVTEPITVYAETTEITSTEYAEGTTKAVSPPVVSQITEKITTKQPELISEGVPVETTAYTASELVTEEYYDTTPITTTINVTTEYKEATSEVSATEIATTSEYRTAIPTEKNASTIATERSTLKYPEMTELVTSNETITEGTSPATQAFEKFTSTTETGVTLIPITGITEEYTVKPNYTTVFEGITEEMSTPEYTTPVSVNETIPSIIEQEFDKAGYPIDATSIKQQLPDSYVYTACIPYHQYLNKLPLLMLQDLTKNQSAFTNVMINHICRGITFSNNFKNAYTCTSIGNTPITLISRNGHHYCNNILIIQPDIPTADGVVHIIDGLLYPEPLVTTTTYEITSEVPSTVSTATPVSTTLPQETTIYSEYITTVTELTEKTTLRSNATREPKFLNITEETEVTEGTTIEYATSAETITAFTPEYISTEEAAHTASTLKHEEFTTSTIYAEVTSTPSVSKPATGIPEETTVYQTESPDTTSTSMIPVSQTTFRPEIITEDISKTEPNKTIPAILKEQFQKADQPIDVSDLIPRLPERYLYTAFLPYYYYIIHGLPIQLVQDLGRNKTAVGDLFVNHICPEVTYSHQFQSGYLCTSLGGPTITVMSENGRYFANGFPIIDIDIHTLDGVVHLIDGLFIEGATPPPELAPRRTTPTTSILSTTSEPVTEFEAYTTESSTSVSTGFTPATSTRESKMLNISEPTESYTEVTSTSAGVTEEVTPSKEYAATTKIGVVPTLPEFSVTEAITTTEATATGITTSYLTTLYETSTSELPTEYTETKEPSLASTEVTSEGITKPTEVTVTSKEYTTPSATSDTIPSILENQFNKSGNPIDATELRPLLPDSDLYTAFLPTYYYIMHDLPLELVHDLTRNKTAVGVVFANHICKQARYSTDFPDGVLCTSIGGLPIVITVVNGKYFANGFPIFRKDIPTIDGVVHLIDGLFMESVTPPPMITTTTPTISTYTKIPVSPEVTTVTIISTEVMPPEITSQAISTESTTVEEGYTTMVNVTIPGEAQVTEKVETTVYTTLVPATREPKVLNISEETTEYQLTKEPDIRTEETTTTYATTLEAETTKPSTLAEYSTTPVFTDASTETVKETTEYYTTTEVQIQTEHSTREPKLLNETASPREYTITDMTTEYPEVTQETTITPVEYTSTVIANVSEVTEIIPSKYTPSVSESVPTTTYEFETTTHYLEKYTTSKEVATTEYKVTEEVQISTVPPEYATTKYPELYNVSTAITELTGFTEEETTPFYPEINATTTLPFYPPESRGILSVSIFFYLVDLSGIDTTLSQGGPYTILAPVDSAFHALPTSVMTQLKVDMPFLREILLYHIIPQKIVSTELQNDNLLTSLQGQGIRCNIYGPVITLGGAKIVMPDGSSGYGVLHIVNRVLYPVPVGTVLDTIQPRNDTDKVQALLRNTTLPSKLKGPGPFTVFLPSDRAINSLPSYVMDILENNATMLEEFVLNHMVSGTYYTAGMSEGLELNSLGGQILRISQAGGLTVNGVPIVSPDISVTNGVVHIIDQVLFDPSQDIYIPKTQPEIRKDLNVFELTKQLNLTTFANLLVDSGLSVNLSAPGYYTVFAPTNDAFAAMPASQLDTIKSDPLRLVQILLYHILPVQIETNQMTNEMVIPSLLPTKSVRMNIYVNNRGPWYTASGSQILMPNNEASNGVVHVVHQVLYIPLGDIVQTVEKCSILQTLRHIISISGLEDQLRGGNYTLLAPNDAAFNKLPEETLERLTLDPHLSRLFLLGHLIRGTVNTEGIFDESTLTTASNNQLYVRALKDCILLNSAAIQYPDVTADNGVVHVIDRVL